MVLMSRTSIPSSHLVFLVPLSITMHLFLCPSWLFISTGNSSFGIEINHCCSSFLAHFWAVSEPRLFGNQKKKCEMLVWGHYQCWVMGTQRFNLCPINGIISLSKNSFVVPWKGMDFAVKHKIHSFLRCVTICEAAVVSHRVVVKCI